MTRFLLLCFFLCLASSIHDARATTTPILPSETVSSSNESTEKDPPAPKSITSENAEVHEGTTARNHNSYSGKSLGSPFDFPYPGGNPVKTTYNGGSQQPIAIQPNAFNPYNPRARSSIQNYFPTYGRRYGRRRQLGRSGYYYGNQNPYVGYPGLYMNSGTGGLVQPPSYVNSMPMVAANGQGFFPNGWPMSNEGVFPNFVGTNGFPYPMPGVPIPNMNPPFTFSTPAPQLLNPVPNVCPFARLNKAGICNQALNSDSNTVAAATETVTEGDVSKPSEEPVPTVTVAPPQEPNGKPAGETPDENGGQIVFPSGQPISINGMWYWPMTGPSTGRNGEKE